VGDDHIKTEWCGLAPRDPASIGAAIEQGLEQRDRLKKFSKNESAYIT
jgi:hypothetical protein